ncbi:hypothetical protein [Bifidobacterium pseudocatenulatum]|uniref:hypothetical protein n=1 Tax=Bifidobacterium pseudocatenulatum TaxID=28026 RepID=UPI001C8CAFE1|nr:hypothetical protein [Bifidobacterium pseudocatenulatum]
MPLHVGFPIGAAQGADTEHEDSLGVVRQRIVAFVAGWAGPPKTGSERDDAVRMITVFPHNSPKTLRLGCLPL